MEYQSATNRSVPNWNVKNQNTANQSFTNQSIMKFSVKNQRITNWIINLNAKLALVFLMRTRRLLLPFLFLEMGVGGSQGGAGGWLGWGV